MNWRISKNGKEFVLHGGQDDWLHEGKTSDPPVTVFFPDGRPPLRLETAVDMKRFYENVMRVQWEYAAALAVGALDSQVQVAGTIQVGSQVFRSRAVQAWFMAHGDPFDAVNMADVGEEIVGVQDKLTTELAGMSVAHVVGTLLAATETFRQRMEAALPPATRE